MKEYKKRIVDSILLRKLEGKGAVLIEGPKWCGKTTTAEQIAKSSLYMNDPKNKNQNIFMSDIDPQKLLNGDTPRLIDEWQIAPKLWDAIRFEVDHRGELGQFILTGSTLPLDTKEITHLVTGRFSFLTMRPMSLYESNESNGEISLENLFSSPSFISSSNNIDLNELAFLTCRGGWPVAINMRKQIALDQVIDYYDGIIRLDMSSIDNTKKSPARIKRLMRSLSRNQGRKASISLIAKDIKANEGESLSEDTISSYINALKKLFIIEDMTAWNPNLRSKTVIRTSDTRYFVDPSIACASLGIGPFDLINDLNTFGLLFETLAIRDLRVYADYLNGEVYHYKDKDGLECDAVIHLRNGTYALIEIKLGGDKLINEGITTLKALKNKIDTTKMKEPSFLMVLTGVGEYAYKNKDGIYIVPIGTLKN